MSKGKKVFIFCALGFLALAMIGGNETKTTSTRDEPDEFGWTKDTRLSGECAEQISQHRATARCQAEGERWNAELTRKLHDPAWRAQMMENAERYHWDVRPPR